MADSQHTTVKEVWKTIPGHPRYDVSNLGRVRSWNYTGCMGWKILMPTFRDRKTKRQYINFSHENKIYCYRIHVLVLRTFVGPRPHGMVGCHNDDNPLNNSLSNLRWDTHKGNGRDKKINGKSFPGESNPASKLKDSDIVNIRNMYKLGFSQRCLSRLFHVSRPAIRYIIDREKWKHI